MIGLTASDLQNVRPALGPLKHNVVVSSIASRLFPLNHAHTTTNKACGEGRDHQHRT